MSPLLSTAVKAAVAAGEFISKAKTSARVVEDSRRDIKLDLDRQAEGLILSVLGSDLPVLCEENGWIGGPSQDYWVIDGIDGTVNLRHGIPIAAVSIGLVSAGQPVLGAIYDFTHDELFAGEIGAGITLNGQPVRPSETQLREKALLLTALATKGDFDADSLARFGQNLARWRKIRMLGSAALSLAYVAAGRADACEIAGIMDWDVTAGLALLAAAGGASRTLSRGNHVVDIVATNGLIPLE